MMYPSNPALRECGHALPDCPSCGEGLEEIERRQIVRGIEVLSECASCEIELTVSIRDKARWPAIVCVGASWSIDRNREEEHESGFKPQYSGTRSGPDGEKLHCQIIRVDDDRWNATVTAYHPTDVDEDGYAVEIGTVFDGDYPTLEEAGGALARHLRC